jgi:hypothetical protein
VSFISLLDSQLQNLVALQITCFNDVKISNFFCDPAQLVNLSCSVTFTNNVVMYFIGAIFGFVPISGILYSYCKIVSSILKILSSSGRYKAFSPFSGLLILWNRHWSVSWINCITLSQQRCSDFINVYCDHSYAESLHLQPEEQRY